MAKINDVYDIGAAFEAIENELMASMIRNMNATKRKNPMKRCSGPCGRQRC